MKVCCIQINSGADIDANIAKVEMWVADACNKCATVVALPENVFLMEAPGSARSFYTLQEHPGIRAGIWMAKKYNCWLLIGSVAVKVDESGKTPNRSLLINPEGVVVTQYDKIHLFDVELPGGEIYAESARMSYGDKAVIARVNEAKLGMTICYDVRFPHLYRALAKAGADIIAVPAAFTQTTGEAHWHVLLRARAIETGCFIIAPAQTGTHPGNRKTFGHALIIDPWGKILADAGTDEGIIMAELDLDHVKQVRARMPVLAHDRAFSLPTDN